MAAATPEEVVAVITVRAPLYATNVNVTALSQTALTFIGPPFRGQQAYAAAMLVCHWLTLIASGAAYGGASGPLTMAKEGQLEKQFSDRLAGGWQANLAATSWGMELIAVRMGVLMGARTSIIS